VKTVKGGNGKNMKKKRLVIYFCICLALLTLLGVSFFYLRKLNALEQNNERVDHSYQVIIQTNLLEQNLLNAETSQRGYLLSGNPGFLETYLSDLKGIPGILLRLDRLTADNSLQQRSLDTLRSVINKQVNLLKKDMTGNGADSISVNSFHESSLHMKMIRELIDRIKNNEEGLLL
jgi:CHASE3 domain sensor protein